MSHAPSPTLAERHRRLRQRLAVEGLDALVVTALPNITYLTNFTGTSAIVVLSADRLVFLTDSRYVASIESSFAESWACPGLELSLVEGAYDTALAELLRRAGWRRIGVEGQHLTVARYRWLETATGADGDTALVSTEQLVEHLRVVKDAYEIECLRVGGRMISEVARHVFREARRGRTEREVGWAIDRLLREAGFSRNAFETIVASGPNSALPHARPTERMLGEGDLVVLDFGGVYDSYCVDLTRTVSIGQASARSREVHSAVRDAHDRAVAAVAPGISRFAIDQAARDSLTAAGMGQAFGHGTGHGLGLEIHEDPRVTRWRPDVDARSERLDTGMVFTIEPGAYFPTWGGVRIEDDMLVTDDGGELLTDVTTELIDTDAWT